MEKENKTKSEEKIEVSKSVLENLIADIKEQKKINDMLLQVADKKQLSHYYARNQQNIPKTCALATFHHQAQEKIVLGWRMTQDEVYKDSATGRWVEKQKIKLLFEDGTDIEVPYVDWVRQYKTAKANIGSRSQDEITGDITLKVVLVDTGKEYSISVKYVNP